MTRAELIPAVVAAITPAVSPHVVVANDYGVAASQAMETALTSGTGVVVAVSPIMSSTLKSKTSGGAFACANTLSVAIRCNRAKAPSFDMNAAHDAVVAAIFSAQSLDADAGAQLSELVVEDLGSETYEIHFTITTDSNT